MAHTGNTAGSGRNGNTAGSGRNGNTANTDAGETKSAASRLFDIRLLIGGLFVVYGLLLTVDGFFTSDAELRKASDININLWMGICMLIVGLLFLLWQRLRPLKVDPNPVIDEGRPRDHGH